MDSTWYAELATYSSFLVHFKCPFLHMLFIKHCEAPSVGLVTGPL